MSPPDPQLARHAEDIVVAGKHTLLRSAQRREDHETISLLNRAHDWLLERVSQELRLRR